jgi:hypothetical protein
LFVILFDPQAGGSAFLQNVLELAPHFKASHPRRYYYASQPENLLTDLTFKQFWNMFVDYSLYSRQNSMFLK